MRLILTSVFALFLSFYAVAQDKEGPKDPKAMFTEAGYHMEYKNYPLALPLYKTIDSLQSGNANINYRIGWCYVESKNEQAMAIPYLQKAAEKVNRSWDDLSYLEKNAPQKTYYYLGRSYHLTNQLDSAIINYKKYASLIHPKHVDQSEVTRLLENCIYAKEQLANPLDVDIINLTAINSGAEDICPVIIADESMMIFTSRREGTTGDNTDLDGRYLTDIYVSQKDSTNNWGAPEKIGASINTPAHDAAIGLSADGQRLFVYKDDDGDGNIYQSYQIGNTWTTPEKMSASVSSTEFESHASISPNGDLLFVSAEKKKGGMGGRDIYVCKKLPNGEWGGPYHLGPVINTPYDEDSPFIHPDGKTLYFASKGHPGMGGYDLFFSEMQADETWSTPVNMRHPINTTNDDVFFVQSVDGRRGYYSSARTGGMGDQDIYMIDFKDVKEKPLTVFKGLMAVKNEEGTPIDATILVYDNASPGAEPLTFKPNSETGKYIIILEPGKDYKIEFMADDTPVYKQDLKVPEGTDYNEIEQAVGLKTVTVKGQIKDEVPEGTLGAKPVEVVATPSPVAVEVKTYQSSYFIYNGIKVNPQDKTFKKLVEEVIAVVKAEGQVMLIVEGSASKVPTTKYGTNEALAGKRAAAGKEQLLNALKEKKQDTSKITLETREMVQGPDYQNDAQKNKSEYEKYQYIKIYKK